MNRCVVLGANGFIGSHVSLQLLEAGNHVVACDIARNFSMLQGAPMEHLEFVTLDFLDAARLDDVLQGADWVFHLVSTTIPATSNQNMAFDAQSNLIGAISLLEACQRAKISKVVFASSGGTVYGKPTVLPVPESADNEPLVSYGITKLAVEKYCNLFTELYGLDTVCLRLANPYGPRHFGAMQGAVSVFLKRVLAGQSITLWGDGSVVRDYVYVEDAARSFLAAARYHGASRVFNIGSGKGVSLLQLLELVREVVACPVNVEFSAGRPFDVPAIYLDVSLAERELGWTPSVNLRDGIQRTWNAILSAS